MMIKNTILAVFILCLFSVSVYADSEKDAQINSMLKSIDVAAENKNAKMIAKYLDDNIHIVINLTVGDQSQLLEFDKDQYMKALKDGWVATEEYTYTRDGVHIKYIGGGNKAVVTSKVYELTVVAGQPMAALSQEKMLVEFKSGAPIIATITANTDVRM